MKRVAFIFTIFLLAGVQCLAQQKVNGYSEEESSDFRTRAAFTLGLKPVKALDMSLSEEVRFRGNSRSFDRSYTTFNIKVAPAKRFHIIGSYTFGVISKESKDMSTFRHRANGGLEYTIPAGRVRFSIREMAQCTWRRDSINVKERANPELILRSRLRIALKSRSLPLTPYVGFELYNTLNSPEQDLSSLKVINGTKPDLLKNYICRYRAAAGLKYKFNAHTSIEAFYRFDNNINYDVNIGRVSQAVNRVVKETERRHIAGVELTVYL